MTPLLRRAERGGVGVGQNIQVEAFEAGLMEDNMEEIKRGQLPFSQVHHVCMVVKDLEKAKKYYESLGGA
jgi:hypothetical protein